MFALLMVLAAEAAEAPEIVVNGAPIATASTGSKTGTDPRDVPAAIVVIPREVLRQQDARTLDTVLQNASAVQPSFGGGYGLADNYTIRGLPMRFLRDGLPDGPTFVGYRRTLADVDSVEVLKGPGSALYGRAEAGGSVNLTTLAPAREAGLQGALSYGSFDTRSATLDATAPLGGVLAARVIGNYEQTDGFRGLDRRFIDILPTVTADLGAHRLTLDYDHREQRLRTDNYGIPFTQARQLAAVDADARFYSPFNRVTQDIDRVTLSDQADVAPGLALRAAVVYDRRKLSITRNAGGNVLDATGTMTGRGGRVQTDDNDYWTGQFEAVLRKHTGLVSHTTLLGVEYADTTMRTVRRTYALPNVTVANGTARAPETVLPATVPSFDRRITSTTLSVYGQEQAEIGRLKLRVGGRLDAVKLVDDGLVGTAARRIAGSPELFSWQAGAVYAFNPALSVYGGYASGQFVSVQTESNALSPVPENSSQVEVGIKAEPIAGRLSVNVAAFSTTRDKYFVTLIAGGDPVQVGSQKSRGVEVDVSATLFDGFTLIGSAAYIDGVNRSAALASVTGIVTNQSMLGKRLASTPEWSGSLWANYAPKHGPLAGVTLGAGVTYKGSVFADSLELLRVPAYTTVRAAVGYDFGPVEAQLTVTNLTDARWFTTATGSGAWPGEPRSAMLTLRAKL